MGKDGEEGRLMEVDWRWVSTGVPRREESAKAHKRKVDKKHPRK
jgi:hypothetical protein